MALRTTHTWALTLALGMISTALLGLGSTARAALPYAGTVELAQGRYAVVDSNGREHRVEIAAYSDRPVGGAETVSLGVSVTSCAGNLCRGHSFYKALEPGEFVVSDSGHSATLTTTFAGSPLRVEWDGCDQCFSGSTCICGTQVSHHEGGEAVADVTLFGLRCKGPGLVDRETRVDTGSASPQPGGQKEPRRPPPPFSGADRITCNS